MILYKRNQSEVPIYWNARWLINDDMEIIWGVVSKSKSTIIIPSYAVSNKGKMMDSVYLAKQKEGYMPIYGVRDETPNFPYPDYTNVHDIGAKNMYNWLNTYLPKNGILADGTESVMLAKLYDYDSVINKNVTWLDQPKINGERCNITIEFVGGLFRPFRLHFWSRLHNEFVYLHPDWANALLEHIPPALFDKMVSGEVTLDGELYIPGRPINEINHVIKSPNMQLKDKMDLQFWMYDLMWEGVKQKNRLDFIDPLIESDSKLTWLNGKNLDNFQYTQKHILVYLGYWEIDNVEQHKQLRDRFINCGFEGVILRDADGLYQYGKRNMTMIKYKRVHEGTFEILDVVSEGKKRPDFGILVLKNDINEEQFTCTYAAPFMMKKDILANRNAYICSKAHVEFRERSGVKSLPFHAQCVLITK